VCPFFSLFSGMHLTNEENQGSRKCQVQFLPSDLADTVYADIGGSVVYGLSAATRLLELRVGTSPGTWMPLSW